MNNNNYKKITKKERMELLNRMANNIRIHYPRKISWKRALILAGVRWKRNRKIYEMRFDNDLIM